MQYAILILAVLSFFSRETFAFSKTADELYHDLIKMENNGALPEYLTDIKPALKKDGSLEGQPEEARGMKTHMQEVREFQDSVEIDARRMPEPPERKTWNELVKAAASGNLTIFEVDEIKRAADNAEPEAVELLAWMYARGMGVQKNLRTAWFLYMKAADLQVENAIDNAQLIYKNMSEHEKRTLLEY